MDLKYRTSHDLNYDWPYLVLLVSFVDVGLVQTVLDLGLTIRQNFDILQNFKIGYPMPNKDLLIEYV